VIAVAGVVWGDVPELDVLLLPGMKRYGSKYGIRDCQKRSRQRFRDCSEYLSTTTGDVGPTNARSVYTVLISRKTSISLVQTSDERSGSGKGCYGCCVKTWQACLVGDAQQATWQAFFWILGRAAATLDHKLISAGTSQYTGVRA
jgi:hypothetical protein